MITDTPDTGAADVVEHLAKQVAMWHGQKMVRGRDTLAATMGYGEFGDASMKYARDHWRQYTAIVDAMILPALARAESADAERIEVARIAADTADRLGEMRAERNALVRVKDAGENLAIAVAMGWDLDGVMAQMKDALDALPPGLGQSEGGG